MRAATTILLLLLAQSVFGQFFTGAKRSGFSSGPSPSNSNGMLLSNNVANPSYFTNQSGQAVYLTGSHTWNDNNIGVSLPAIPWPTLASFMSTNNFNCIRLWTWDSPVFVGGSGGAALTNFTPFLRTGPGTAADGGLKFDLTQYDPTYFANLSTTVQNLLYSNWYGVVMIGEGYTVANQPTLVTNWVYQPWAVGNNINGFAFTSVTYASVFDPTSTAWPIWTNLSRKFIDTLNAYPNFVWETANEPYTNCLNWETNLVNLVHAYELTKALQHPIMISPFNWLMAHTNSLADAFGFSDSIGGVLGSAQGLWSTNPPPRTSPRPVIEDTDHVFVSGDVGVWAWKNFMRGNQPIHMDDMSASAAQTRTRHAMGDTLTYANRINLISTLPTTNAGIGGYASGQYVLTNKNEFLIYHPDTNMIATVILPQNSSWDIEWFNTVTRQTYIPPVSTVSHVGGLFSYWNPFWTANGASPAADGLLYLKTNSTARLTIPSTGTNNLIGWWRMGENTGTNCLPAAGPFVGTQWSANGTLPIYANGSSGTKALAFNATNGNYVGLPFSGPAAFADNLSAMTVSIWIKGGIQRSNVAVIAEKLDVTGGGNGIGWELRVNYSAGPTGDVFGAIVNGVNYFYADNASVNVLDGNWHNVVLTRSGNTIHLYVDGVAETSTGSNGAVATIANAFDVGIGGPQLSALGFDYLNGSLEDFRIYNATLSAANALAIFNAGPAVTP